ncbi:MAG: DinB family protein [Flavobacteriales bacterium]|nr:MAG: DinB family protein [Flavobacteriales bacterium]
MSITFLLREYADYDLWANTRFVQRLAVEPDAVLDAPVRSSFPSLRSTLLHIRDAEHVWRCRLTGERHSWPAEPSLDPATLVDHASRLHGLVSGMDEADLLSLRTYRDLKGNEHRSAAWRMLMHCYNHSTQHRGQLITMMRGLGLDGIPANDLIVYQRSLKDSV